MKLAPSLPENAPAGIISHVVANGACVGCGLCAGLAPETLKMELNSRGCYEPVPRTTDPEGIDQLSETCPFASTTNEDDIAKSLFGQNPELQHHEQIGYFVDTHVGFVTDPEHRASSTSGGLITWIAEKLLSEGIVDTVACVVPSEHAAPQRLFEYRLVTDLNELKQARKSRYYPVQFSKIIPEIRAFDGRVLFIGLPCFVKAIRLAAQADKTLAAKVTHTVGLFCGHLKSTFFSEYLIRSTGSDETQITTVDFRKKIAGQKANHYGFEAFGDRTKTGTGSSWIPMRQVFANSWTYNLFMLKACEFCDDIMAETADASVGDAWLPEYVEDDKGISVLVVRSAEIATLIENGHANGELELGSLSTDKLIATQRPTLQQRRAGLQYRLHLAEQRGQWHPIKRFGADPGACNLLYKAVQHLRMATRESSFRHWASQRNRQGRTYFIARMTPLILISWLANELRHIRSRSAAVKRRLLRLLGADAR